MTTESLTRTPKEGSNRFKVLRAITEQGIPVWDTRAIVRATELSRIQVTAARSNLRLDGRLPKPTEELTWLTQHSQAAEVFPLVKEYREMGLSLRQIQFAVKKEKGIMLSNESVHSAVGYNTRKGNIRKLSEQEEMDIKVDAQTLTQAETEDMVSAMLELRKYLLRNNHPLPTHRLEWKMAIEQIPLKSNLLDEWIRLSNLLGRSPLPNDIESLHTENATRFPRSVYEKHFGKGDFEEAKTVLDCLSYIQNFADTIFNNPIEIFPRPVAIKDVLEARERILAELSSILTLDNVDELREKALALKEETQVIQKEIGRKPHSVLGEIGEDERSIWETIVTSNLENAMIAQGIATQSDFDLVREFFEKGLVGEGLNTDTLTRFSLAFVRATMGFRANSSRRVKTNL